MSRMNLTRWLALTLTLLLAPGSLRSEGARAKVDWTLDALFVDLEFEPAERDGGLAIERALNDAARLDPDLRGHRVRFDFIHYADLTPEILQRKGYELVVLSPQGTPWARYASEAPVPLARAKDLVRHLIMDRRTPLLGVCGGHQFLALVFGGKTDLIDPTYRGQKLREYPEDSRWELGDVELRARIPDPILAGVPTAEGLFLVSETHHEEVSEVKDPLVNLASSEMSPVQILRVKGRVAYGVQFHPERDTEGDAGRKLLTNFLRMVIEGRRGPPRSRRG